MIPKGKKCPGIEGLLEEAKEIMSEAQDPDVRDAGMLAAAQSVEHYEISRYGTLIAWAEELVLVAPVVTAPGEGTHVAVIDAQQGSEAVVLDLVNPAMTSGGSAERVEFTCTRGHPELANCTEPNGSSAIVL